MGTSTAENTVQPKRTKPVSRRQQRETISRLSRPRTASMSAAEASPQHSRRNSASQAAAMERLAQRPKTASQEKHKKKVLKDDSVFDRLHSYGDAKRKHLEQAREAAAASEQASVRVPQLSAVTKQLTKSRNAGDCQNYGEKLYTEAKQREAQLKKLREAAAEEINDEEATFRPTISKMAQRMGQDGDIVERLGKYQDIAEKQKAKLAEMRESEKMEGCTFAPEVNKDARAFKTMLRRRPEQAKAHELLFEDAKVRHERQTEYKQWFPLDHTFKPDLSQSRAFMKKSKRIRQLEGESREDFINRLVNSKKETEARIEEVRRGRAEAVAEYSKVKPFKARKPPVSVAQSLSRNRGNVSDHLYATWFEYDDMKERRIQRENEKAHLLASTVHTPKRSRVLAENLRREALGNIFELLDQDGDGIIDPQEADVTVLGDREAEDDIAHLLASVATDITSDDFIMLFTNHAHVYPIGPRMYLHRFRSLANLEAAEPAESEPEPEPARQPRPARVSNAESKHALSRSLTPAEEPEPAPAAMALDESFDFDETVDVDMQRRPEFDESFDFDEISEEELLAQQRALEEQIRALEEEAAAEDEF
ncbi:hypothetical protein J8273_5157 [Carpediemonas membranifera]|nr:hypothetical protein J8273_5157 [Carpediemonas membranifera]|eukprot:KAG9392176.1 hypothetical protein J8273_5157 [Carpediemonas membranifera]